MPKISNAKKPSESLPIEVLFPCECGNKDAYIVRVLEYSQAVYECTLGFKKGPAIKGLIAIDGFYGVLCHCCDKTYKPTQAGKVCEAYRKYLDCDGETKKRAAWQRFVRARKRAEIAPHEVAKSLDLDWPFVAIFPDLKEQHQSTNKGGLYA